MNMRFAEASLMDVGAAAASHRHLWIDVARALALLLVVAGHTARGLAGSGIATGHALQSFDVAIYSFHIPLFFLISGLLYARSIKRRPFMLTWKERAVRLIKPGLIWSVVLVVLLVLAAGRANNPVAPAEAVLGLLLLPIQPVSIFWFLYTLLICMAVSGLALEYLRLTRAQLLAGSAILHLAYLLFFTELQSGPGLHLVRFTEHQLYFALGVCLAQSLLVTVEVPAGPAKVGPNVAWKLAAFTALSALCCGIAVAVLVTGQLSYHSPVGTLAALSGSSTVLSACYFFVTVERWPVPPLMKAVSTESLAIFCMHVPFLALTRIALQEAGISGAMVHFLTGTVLGIAGPLVALHVMRSVRLETMLGFEAVPRAALRARRP
jgi:fucose 4-O-acetylase-like acetyltransferase